LKFENYNEDQYDLLRELTNIAIGQATAELDQLWNTRVEFSIPQVSMVAFNDMRGKLLEFYASFSGVSVVKQIFDGLLSGEILLIFGEEAMSAVSKLKGKNEALNLEEEQILLRDTSITIAGASLNGLIESFDGEISLGKLFFFCERQPFMNFLNDLFPRGRQESSQWKYSLLINVVFTASEDNFDCFILIFLSKASIEKLRRELDQLIEEEY
jgi:chemotaxis protein CheC